MDLLNVVLSVFLVVFALQNSFADENDIDLYFGLDDNDTNGTNMSTTVPPIVVVTTATTSPPVVTTTNDSSTTAVSDTNTTISAPVVPSTTPAVPVTTTPKECPSCGFSFGSFIGGFILALALMVAAFLGHKYYTRVRTGNSYQTFGSL